MEQDSTPAFTVDRLVECTDSDRTAIARLLPQLSSAPVPSAAQMSSFMRDDRIALFTARASNGEIVGMLTLVTFEIMTGVRAIIEDVVVDEAARGGGVGAALVVASLDEARRRGARTVDLTSRPSREAANRLYVRCGFEQRQTNLYRFNFES